LVGWLTFHFFLKKKSGKIDIPVCKYFNMGEIDQWFPLRNQGEIHLKFSLQTSVSAMNQLIKPNDELNDLNLVSIINSWRLLTYYCSKIHNWSWLGFFQENWSS
jgi:hypothetical protein